MDNMSPLSTIIISVLTSSAVLSFIQFMISRYDNKRGVMQTIIAKLNKAEQDVDALKEYVEFTNSSLKDYIEEQNIIQCRIRILRASDELRRNIKHSEESFDQINDDISEYNKYCAAHPEFKNNKAIHAIQNIDRVYAECIRNNTFL